MKPGITLKLFNIFFVCLLSSQAFAQLPPSIPGLPPFPETAQFDIDLADIYVRLLPETSEAEIIASIWLRCDGVNPVLLKLGGNIMSMSIKGRTQSNIGYTVIKPYIHVTNIQAGSHQVVFTYRVKHDGITSTGNITPGSISLDSNTFWYPRNVVNDPHQVILNIETPENFPVNSNGKLTKEAPNNFLRLKQFVLSTPSATGLTLN